MIRAKSKNERASTNWKVIWIDISFPSSADNKRLRKKSESKFQLLFKESEIKELIATLRSFREKKINGYSRRINKRNINFFGNNNNEKCFSLNIAKKLIDLIQLFFFISL